MRALLGLAGLLWLAVPAVALPASPSEVLGVAAVGEPPGPAPELVELTYQLRSVVADRTSGVLEGSQLRERMAGQPSNASLAELDRAYSGALATYQSGDYEGAVRTLRAVIEDLEKLPDGAETFAQWTRAMMRLARAEQAVGRKAEARLTLERLVRAAPTVKVDATQYPPSFEKQVLEAKAAERAALRRRLVVTSSVKGARVYVDGRDVGVAPLTVALAAARYRVSAASGSLRVPPARVDLSEEDQTVALDFSLAEALRPALGPGFALHDQDRARRLVTAAAALGLDRLLAASFTRDGDVTFLVGTLYDVRRGMIQREGKVRLGAGQSAPPGGLSALAGFLLAGQASTLVAPGVRDQPAVPWVPSAQAPPTAPPPSLKPPPQPEKPAAALPGTLLAEPAPGRQPSPEKSKLLGWSAVGCGALAVGLGAFAAAKGVEASNQFGSARALRAAGSVPAFSDVAAYNQRVASGNSASSTATIAGAGAGVALVGAGVLGYLSYRQTGEIGPFRF